MVVTIAVPFFYGRQRQIQKTASLLSALKECTIRLPHILNIIFYISGSSKKDGMTLQKQVHAVRPYLADNIRIHIERQSKAGSFHGRPALAHAGMLGSDWIGYLHPDATIGKAWIESVMPAAADAGILQQKQYQKPNLNLKKVGALYGYVQKVLPYTTEWKQAVYSGNLHGGFVLYKGDREVKTDSLILSVETARHMDGWNMLYRPEVFTDTGIPKTEIEIEMLPEALLRKGYYLFGGLAKSRITYAPDKEIISAGCFMDAVLYGMRCEKRDLYRIKQGWDRPSISSHIQFLLADDARRFPVEDLATSAGLEMPFDNLNRDIRIKGDILISSENTSIQAALTACPFFEDDMANQMVTAFMAGYLRMKTGQQQY